MSSHNIKRVPEFVLVREVLGRMPRYLQCYAPNLFRLLIGTQKEMLYLYRGAPGGTLYNRVVLLLQVWAVAPKLDQGAPIAHLTTPSNCIILYIYVQDK